jgi:hypothetical protein
MCAPPPIANPPERHDPSLRYVRIIHAIKAMELSSLECAVKRMEREACGGVCLGVRGGLAVFCARALVAPRAHE